GLALSRVEQDHAGRSRADLISRALRSPAIAARLGRAARGTAIGARLDLTLRAPCWSRRRGCWPRLSLRPPRPESPPAGTLLHGASLLKGEQAEMRPACLSSIAAFV